MPDDSLANSLREWHIEECGEWPQRIPGDWSTHMWTPPKPEETKYARTLEYALSIDGYAYAQEVWKLDDPYDGSAWDKVETFEDAAGNWHGSFEDLRCCLYIVQRGIKWGEGSSPCTELHRKFRRLYLTLCQRWAAESPRE